ncbi:MAG: Arm DNA-binding domain-containing protein [Acidimicrobiia bacterium]|nr:Arm DNA-binding domain-containing protein [Acidimicrobiia bacterium]
MPQLTSRNVKNACPRKYQDGQGSLLRVRQPGSRYWVLRLAVDRHRREIETDGRLRASSADARTKAFEHRETVAGGPEPFTEKRRCDDPTFPEATCSMSLSCASTGLPT